MTYQPSRYHVKGYQSTDRDEFDNKKYMNVWR